ncbi:hypothetical protein [uncultured Aquimarina sp.]|uniref:hypothetical protein n=1 Tax=uncultured Aquimarina sp. TaxID=575652 RepID=UPI0026371B9E|nr:hypothetical protein [uncultured Aquimarina sp.]
MSRPKKIQKIALDHLDDWFASTGFLYPVNEIQLKRFDKLYENYDFKLKNESIDVDSIINGSLKRSKIIFPWKEEEIEEENFETLRMAARKGQGEVPQHIIDKMLRKHNNKSSNDQ